MDTEVCFTGQESNQTVLFPIISGSLNEPDDEQFSAQLTTRDLDTRVILSRSTAMVTILDNDSE